jgi:protein tyrosine/serine phosphatase
MLQTERATPEPNDLPTFGWMDAGLARGGQPTDAGYRWLAEHGIALIVNLREKDETAAVERAAPSLTCVRIPIKNDRAPTLEQCEKWLALCGDSLPHRGVYVHCKGGNGRTSTLAIVYRIAQGRDLEEAVAEERRYGFDPEGEHAQQMQFLRDLDARVKAGQIALPSVP